VLLRQVSEDCTYTGYDAVWDSNRIEVTEECRAIRRTSVSGNAVGSAGCPTRLRGTVAGNRTALPIFVERRFTGLIAASV
jgi:hypothetical protein